MFSHPNLRAWQSHTIILGIESCSGYSDCIGNLVICRLRHSEGLGEGAFISYKVHFWLHVAVGQGCMPVWAGLNLAVGGACVPLPPPQPAHTLSCIYSLCPYSFPHSYTITISAIPLHASLLNWCWKQFRSVPHICYKQ